MEYPEQTIARLTERLGRAPTTSEIKAERDALIRIQYGSMLMTDVSRQRHTPQRNRRWLRNSFAGKIHGAAASAAEILARVRGLITDE